MVHILDLQFKTSESIASFLIETNEGPVLIETGPHSTFEHLKKGLTEHGYTPEDVKHVFLTHIHFDHAGAAWAMAEAGAKIYVHPRGYKHLMNPERLYNSAKMIYGDEMESLWGEMKSIPEEQLVMVEDEAEYSIGEHSFKAHFTPGHASHHIAWQLGDTIFTGDVAGCKIHDGPVVPPCPPPDINVEYWEESIDRILALKPSCLYLTHYGKVDQVENHFAELRTILHDWANWMKPKYDQGLSAEEITPDFTEYTMNQLREAGQSEIRIAKYEAANPSWMSVAGLLRYWKKKEE
jgi:glyoxylase-like metal-dependent hydrolase (beta-lactamase superfamily II)